MAFRRTCRRLAAALIILCGGGAASANHTSIVVDDHAGRPGGTNKGIIVPSYGMPGSPLVITKACLSAKRPGVHGHLTGDAFGHADPMSKDPLAVCSHGIAVLQGHPNTGRPPLVAGLVKTSPAAAQNGSESSQQGGLLFVTLETVLGLLHQIELPVGDATPLVVETKSAIHAHDVKAAARRLPRVSAARDERDK